VSDWALVTGASRGIGRAIARELARVPLHVVVNARAPGGKAEEVAVEIRGEGGSAEVCAFDVASESAAEAAIEALVARLGAPYVVVNNAGITRDGLMVWMKGADWRDVVDTNLGGFFHVTRPCLKSMLVARRGRIINISSAAGQKGNSGQVNYSASKAGLEGATRALAREVAKRGITVNAVAPGFIETEMIAGLSRDAITPLIPAGRVGRPEEVAAAVRFLAGDGAAYITGQVVAVNGGLT